MPSAQDSRPHFLIQHVPPPDSPPPQQPLRVGPQALPLDASLSAELQVVEELAGRLPQQLHRRAAGVVLLCRDGLQAEKDLKLKPGGERK